MASESEVRTWRCHAKTCQRLKGETNRWWVLYIGKIRLPDDEFPRGFLMRPFEEPIRDDEIAVCSRACAVAELVAYMEGAEHA